MKRLVGTFNQRRPQKGLGAFSVIAKSSRTFLNLRLKLYCVEAGGRVMFRYKVQSTLVQVAAAAGAWRRKHQLQTDTSTFLCPHPRLVIRHNAQTDADIQPLPTLSRQIIIYLACIPKKGAEVKIDIFIIMLSMTFNQQSKYFLGVMQTTCR